MKRILFIGLLLVAAVILVTASPIWFADATVKQVIGTQTYIGLSTDTKPSSPDEGSTFYETNTGRSWIYTGSAWTLRAVKAVYDTTTLRAPGVSGAVSCAGYQTLSWLFTVANINTNVVVAVQLKFGNSNWTSVLTTGVTYTANGDYGFENIGIAHADSARLKFVSETGGTDATITHSVSLSGGM